MKRAREHDDGGYDAHGQIDRLDPIESAFGGIVFAFGGFLTSLIPLTNQLSAAAWLPWAAGAAERLVQHGRTRDFVWLTVFFFLQALSGAPEGWMMTTARTCMGRRPRRRRLRPSRSGLAARLWRNLRTRRNSAGT